MLALLALAAAAGCSSLWPFGGSSSEGERPKLPADAKVYACDGDKQLVLRFPQGSRSVLVVFPDRQFRLDPVAAAGGREFSNGRDTLTLTDGGAELREENTVTYSACKPPAAKGEGGTQGG